MLEYIHIRNLALTRELSLDLDEGLTVLTGETGAGKSILIGALSLALGQTGSSDIIHHDADRAEIDLSFNIDRLPAVQQWLREQALDHDDNCILRRVIRRKGRNQAFINGNPVAQQRLLEIGQQLVDIHGQHAHHALLRHDYQRRLLDDFGDHRELLAKVADSYRQQQSLADDIRDLETLTGDETGHRELLSYQLDELSRLELADDELVALENEQKMLANADALRQDCATVIERLDNGDMAIESQLHDCLQKLTAQCPNAPELQTVIDLLQTAAIQCEEARDELRRQTAAFEHDPERLQVVEQRLDSIIDLARKHHVRPEELPRQLARISEQLRQIDSGAKVLADKRQALAREQQRYLACADKLRKARRSTAKRLAETVTRHMQQLGMPNGQLQIDVVPLPDQQQTQHGSDRIVFQASAHPSLPAAPLEKAASGGELSRISLAIQVVTARQGGIPTLVFDEVDVGIGGRIAAIVGQHLRQLADERQVFCITHLAQVAALGHQHLMVSKESDQHEVRSHVRPLGSEERPEELARMLGGIEITERAEAHARELLEQARKSTESA